jgi:carboxyl-terminal processing protease
MNKGIKYFLFGMAFVSLGLLLGFKITDRSTPGERISLGEGVEKIQQTLSFIQRNYVKDVDNDKLVDDAINGILEGLDPHSIYIPRKQMKEMEEDMNGGFDGIGVEFSIIDDTLYVVSPLSGGPSEKLGIQAGDRIVKVDGENIAGIGLTDTDVMRHLKGPKGTQVKVGIVRRGVKDLLEFDITRDVIPIHSVPYSYMITDDIGYLKVSRFSEKTYTEFALHLRQLLDDGMKNLILDLRNNPGGYLTRAYQMTDEFLPSGKMIVSTDGRISDSRREYVATSAINQFEEGGLIVLIDYGSASASEIVSGAVQDHDRGLIVGVRSFGKGLVQLQHKFQDNSAIRVVISEYFTPSGRCIQKPYDKTSSEYEKEITERFESGEIYDESKIKVPDSLKYYTASGRTVYGGGGIYPDVFSAPDTSGGSRYLTDLTIKDLFRSYAYSYFDNHPNLSETYKENRSFARNFKVTDEMLISFQEYAADHGVKRDGNGFARSRNLIANRIKSYIGRKLYQDDGFFPVIHEMDKVLQEAVSLMPKAVELQQTGKLSLDK